MKTLAALELAVGFWGAGRAGPGAGSGGATPAVADTTHKYENPLGHSTATGRPPVFQQKLVRVSLVPAVLIGYSIAPFTGTAFIPRIRPATTFSATPQV